MQLPLAHSCLQQALQGTCTLNRSFMFNVPASARQARLRSVPWQPNLLKKQNQENSRSSLPFSFSPCSLIKSTKTVSEMLAQREPSERRRMGIRDQVRTYCAEKLMAPGTGRL